MADKKIILNFGEFSLEADIFDTEIGGRFYESLPLRVNLWQWGNEAYGPIEVNLGEENPRQTIPPGGLAYTNQGNYLCVFYGQRPAWAVEYIGQIKGDSWKILLENDVSSMEVSKA